MANRDLARLLLTAISAASLTLSSALLMASTPSSLQSSIELLLLRRPVTLSNILEEKRDYSEFQKNVYLCYMTHLSKSIHLLDHPLLNSYDSEWFFCFLEFYPWKKLVWESWSNSVVEEDNEDEDDVCLWTDLTESHEIVVSWR